MRGLGLYIYTAMDISLTPSGSSYSSELSYTSWLLVALDDETGYYHIYGVHEH